MNADRIGRAHQTCGRRGRLVYIATRPETNTAARQAFLAFSMGQPIGRPSRAFITRDSQLARHSGISMIARIFIGELPHGLLRLLLAGHLPSLCDRPNAAWQLGYQPGAAIKNNAGAGITDPRHSGADQATDFSSQILGRTALPGWEGGNFAGPTQDSQLAMNHPAARGTRPIA